MVLIYHDYGLQFNFDFLKFGLVCWKDNIKYLHDFAHISQYEYHINLIYRKVSSKPILQWHAFVIPFNIYVFPNEYNTYQSFQLFSIFIFLLSLFSCLFSISRVKVEDELFNLIHLSISFGNVHRSATIKHFKIRLNLMVLPTFLPTENFFQT